MLENRHVCVIRLFVICIILWSMTIWACGKSPVDTLEIELRHYKQNSGGSLNSLGDAFVKVVAVDTLSRDVTFLKNQYIYQLRQGRMQLIKPLNRVVTLPMYFSADRISLAVTNNYTVVSDGKTILVYNRDGELKQPLIAGDDKDRVMDVCIVDNQVIYYKDKRLWAYDIIGDKSASLIHEMIIPPYTKMYDVMLQVHGEHICVFSGIAGLYNLTIVNIKSKALVGKNIIATSMRCAMNGNALIFLEGGSGNWSAVSFDFQKKSKNLKQLETLSVKSMIYLLPRMDISSKTLWELVMESGEQNPQVCHSL